MAFYATKYGHSGYVGHIIKKSLKELGIRTVEEEKDKCDIIQIMTGITWNQGGGKCGHWKEKN